MKKLFTLLLSVIATTAVYAQPAFNSVMIPADGYTASVKSITYSGADPASDNGANKNWDYSALDFSSATAATSTLSTNVAGSPYGSSFPTATHFETNASGNYNYYKYTSSSVSIVGYYSQSLIVYSDILTEMTFPIAYTNVQSDTYGASYSSGGFPVTITGTITTTFDGYGTLITPTGTYNNVARFKAVKDETQTTDYGSGITVDMQFLSTTYSWNLPTDQSSKFAIMYIDINMNGSPVSSTATAMLYGTGTTAVNQPEMVTASLYPQPANEVVTIVAPGMQGVAKATLFKTDGSVLRREDIVAGGDGTMTLNVSDVPAGLYLLEVLNGNKSAKQKIVVE